MTRLMTRLLIIFLKRTCTGTKSDVRLYAESI
jgi:hypothetical protein